jgi:hypothetical protein
MPGCDECVRVMYVSAYRCVCVRVVTRSVSVSMYACVESCMCQGMIVLGYVKAPREFLLKRKDQYD